MEIFNEWTHTTQQVILSIRSYPNDNIGIQLFSDDGPYATLTTNIQELPKGEAAIDVNNFPAGIEFINKYQLGEPVEGKVLRSGYCTYPVYKFNLEKLKEYADIPESVEPWEETDE